jgi:hypothetical protein
VRLGDHGGQRAVPEAPPVVALPGTAGDHDGGSASARVVPPLTALGVLFGEAAVIFVLKPLPQIRQHDRDDNPAALYRPST